MEANPNSSEEDKLLESRSSEEDSTADPTDRLLQQHQSQRKCNWHTFTISGLTVALVASNLLWASFPTTIREPPFNGGKSALPRTHTHFDTCSKPVLRREWRNLAQHEQLAYLGAVICLANTPSRSRSIGSIYDDFAFVHMQIGAHTHEAAPFFPWHRMFLHLWEQHLHDFCGFEGALPYWDWTLDWENLAASPIFSNVTGFGGDGGHIIASALDDGSSCVGDGPFRDLELLYMNSTIQRHCLARGFIRYEDKADGHISGNHVRPSAVARLLDQEHYYHLNNATQWEMHNAIHWGLRGDFSQWSSANDPIFYLHHAQLDRIWWLWQQKRASRSTEYYGLKSRQSEETASIQDLLHYLELGSSIPVSEAMQVDAGTLCYRY
ncbi:hypothetical protein M409DRAFT_65119 [Zasmidium cellare ATCC 36951]|uniref:Tyrosinase copper-binding domain-containing protein n=1 Tax=Zasmidium cellare ATCC 36951 TaxID=1080233 RepID=A0A6A6CQV7_ZASCE|nr:uncharacterized protein M409DRAFT_65119 [Zasmidium cellare ATCC 36951]KAF2169475.1 hypothetical protein M409DRAFT_65119 [Zasmidium cellare ATCC 36951]